MIGIVTARHRLDPDRQRHGQGEWEIFWNAVSHMTLPALLLGYYSSPTSRA